MVRVSSSLQDSPRVLVYLFLLIGFPEQSVWGLFFVVHPCGVCLVSFVTDHDVTEMSNLSCLRQSVLLP